MAQSKQIQRSASTTGDLYQEKADIGVDIYPNPFFNKATLLIEL